MRDYAVATLAPELAPNALIQAGIARDGEGRGSLGNADRMGRFGTSRYRLI